MSDEPYDINGVPIRAGDLLRAFHFRDGTRRGKFRYLYHIACQSSACLEAVPVQYLDSSTRQSGGRYWLLPGRHEVEVIADNHRDPYVAYDQRPRVKQDSP